MPVINFNKPDQNNQMDGLMHAMVDITAPKNVHVHWSEDRKILWVDVNGVCVLRCCQVDNLVVGEPTDE